jgi:hypothetical protein
VCGCLRSKLTVWKEDHFTVVPGQGIKQREARVAEWVDKVLSLTKSGVWGCVQARTQWSTDSERIHTLDLDTTGCVSLVMLVMTQVVRTSSISILTSVRIIGEHTPTIKTLFSSSRGDSTEWRKMCQDSRSKSGRRTLTHHGHLWL